MGALILARIIPVIVVDNGQAFHMVRFKINKYLGDPMNICRIFNEKNCDELVILDISKNQNNTLLGSGKLEKLSENVFVPISYGGGLKSEKDANEAFELRELKLSSNVSNILIITEKRYLYLLFSVIVVVGDDVMTVVVDVDVKL